jgi:hypothetical protein
MTQDAYDLFDRALSEQHARNEARRIRVRVHEARGNPHLASSRWPFELFQNALDSGPRSGSSIAIRIRREPRKLIFEHDGAPFLSSELAALLSGGSSKEFESEVTTGRYGTGFLVTHVLAERTTLRGLLKVSRGYEQFQLTLDRSGDEEEILTNTRSCNDAIRLATPVTDFSKIPSASFEYLIDDDHALLAGLKALKQALPYLYITRLSLGRVEFEEVDDTAEIWMPGRVVRTSIEGGTVEHRAIEIERDGIQTSRMFIYRFMSSESTTAGALVLVEQFENRWQVRLPDQDTPRIYREYPLRGSGFLPINFILDGRFDPDQERIKLSMSEGDKRLLENAFTAAVMSVKYAFKEQWINAHLLARAHAPSSGFDPTNATETKWWTEQLASFAERLAKLPIVDCTTQLVPAIVSEGPFADFVLPRLLPDSTADETTIDRLWPLVAAATNLLPPKKELAHDWTEIAEGWHSLGLEITRVTVSDLAESVRNESNKLDDIYIEGDPIEWLANLIDIVGECWSKRNGIEPSVLAELLPDQNRLLRSPSELQRDGGISTALKDICQNIDQDVRSKLLLGNLEEIATRKELIHLRRALKQALPTSLSEEQVLNEAIKHLSENLPEDEECTNETANLQNGTATFLKYLWSSQGKNATSVARKVPLIASNNHAVRWSHDQ